MNLLKQGRLNKLPRNKNNSSWKKLNIVYLQYNTDTHSSVLQYTKKKYMLSSKIYFLDLYNAIVRQITNKSKDYTFRLDLINGDTHIFSCESKDELDSWLDILERVGVIFISNKN